MMHSCLQASRILQPSKLQHHLWLYYNKQAENMGALLSIPLLAVPSMGTVSWSSESWSPTMALIRSTGYGLCCELLWCGYVLCNL